MRKDEHGEPARTPESSEVDAGSVTYLLHDWQANRNDAAINELWSRFFPVVRRWAEQKLCGMGATATEGDDVAVSVLERVRKLVDDGGLPNLSDTKSLRAVLIKITSGKVIDRIRATKTLKRGGDQVINSESRLGTNRDGEPVRLDDLASNEWDPIIQVEMADAIQAVLGSQKNEDIARAAAMDLIGYTNKEIAAELGVARVTVERWLNIVRKSWKEVWRDE